MPQWILYDIEDDPTGSTLAVKDAKQAGSGWNLGSLAIPTLHDPYMRRQDQSKEAFIFVCSSVTA